MFKLLGLTSSTLISDQENQFFRYIAEYGKTYGTKEEYNFRLQVFADRLAEIEQINAENGTSTVGLNQFADWTKEEMKKLNGFKPMATATEKQYREFDTSNLADSIDWRAKGAVTPVKDQGQCGSCWAFSTTGSLEGAHFMATGNLVSLSESNLVDCSLANQGCNGGMMDLAFKYAERHPLMTEADYPYKPKTGPFACKYKKDKGVVTVKNFDDVKVDSADQLKAALNEGPVSVAIEADQTIFQMYTGGVITSADCGTQLDHGVLAVGYGVENGQEYYIVKNSWGPNWGDNGYVKLGVQDGAGICGIQMQPSIPHTN